MKIYVGGGGMLLHYLCTNVTWLGFTTKEYSLGIQNGSMKTQDFSGEKRKIASDFNNLKCLLVDFDS